MGIVLQKCDVLVRLALGLGMLAVSACQGPLTPGIGRPWTFDIRSPAGPPEYQKGWEDGCESALSGYGSQFTKAFHSLKKDGALINNPTYQRVWRDAYDYCRAGMKATQLQGYGNYNNSWYE